ncbi:jmjd6-b, partial [Symbiodinium sp. KB8]
NRKVRIVKAIISRVLSWCSADWTVTPEREEMLEEFPGCIATFAVGDGMGTGLADIHFRDAQGRQCAHVAIMCIGEEELRLIASLKGEVNGQDFAGLTPLHLAARLGRHEAGQSGSLFAAVPFAEQAAKALLALKAYEGSQLSLSPSRTPLMVAASAGLNDTRDPPPIAAMVCDANDVLHRGSRLAEQGLFVEALAAFRDLDPPAVSTPELLEAIAQCELMLDTASSAHRAVEAARNAVALAPGATLTLPEAKQTLARALMSAFRVPEAIETYQQVLTLRPGDAEASEELSEATAALKAHERRLATLPGTEEDWAARRRRLLEQVRAQRRPNWKEADWKVHSFARLDLGAIYGRCMDNIARVDVQDEKYKDFGREYQSRSVPALINGAMHRWPAMGRWRMENFSADFGHQKIICDHRFGIRMRFNDFRDYMAEQEDDTPLYLFDHAFGEYPSTKTLLSEYEVPEAFQSDLLAELGTLRPPFRWLLLGPRRSGSTLHKDPLGTSAWNALVFGKKLWVLFPPSTPPELLRPEADTDFSEESASCWFLHWWKSARARAWPERFTPIEFLQQPGEVVFVPARWWHAVLNLEDSLAVTQNFCNEWNVGNVWRCTSATHPVLARHLRQSLKCHRPDLCESLMAKQPQMDGDDPKVSYVFDRSSRQVALDKQEEPMSSDDEYLTWMANGPKRRRYSGEEDPKRPKKSHAEKAAEEEADRNQLPFGSSELEKVLTQRAWGCFDCHASFPAMDAETLVTLARVAERAERYDEMANYMKPFESTLLVLRVCGFASGFESGVGFILVHLIARNMFRLLGGGSRGCIRDIVSHIWSSSEGLGNTKFVKVKIGTWFEASKLQRQQLPGLGFLVHRQP